MGTRNRFSSGGIGEDSKNGEQLATLLTAPLASQGSGSLTDAYDQLTGNVAAGSQSASAAADGFRGFQQSLESQHMAISGVNIDEEAVKMIEYQRASMPFSQFFFERTQNFGAQLQFEF